MAQVLIQYCPVWESYDVRAASLAAELNDAGHEASIEEGAKGQYDVLADGQVVFSKQNEGRFPNATELRALLA